MGEVFSVNKEKAIIKRIKETNFSEIGWSEPDEIEEVAVNNLSILTRQGRDDESLLLIGRQVVDSTQGKNDLVALDSVGNLVLIEIKRDKKDVKARRENIELQAIRYASALARIDNVNKLLEKIYIPYIYENKNVSDPEKHARNKIYDFIKSNNINSGNINRRQRIVLFANGYDRRSLSSLAWLSDNGVDITVLRGDLYEDKGKILMSIEQLLPSIQEEEYYIGIKDKSIPTKDTSSNYVQKNDIRMGDLIDNGVLSKGDELRVKGEEGATAKLVDKRCVEVDGDRLTTNEWASDVKGWPSINIYDHVIHVEEGKLLDHLRSELFDKIRGVKAQ